MKNLSIILLTYNSENIIELSLEKLDANQYDVIVVDNGSSDGTVALIKKKFPKVQIIQTGQNIGFGRGNNVALKQVKTEFALVINPDSFIEKADIEKVLKVMQSNKNIALASAVLYNGQLDHKENKIINAKPCEVSQRNLLADKGEFFNAKFISGACMFMRMAVFQKIGFFDEHFFMYCEDNEINKRAKNHGYDTAIVKDTKFFHLCRQSSSKPNAEINYLIEWHKYGWSKCYYTQAVHNKLIAKLKALRKIIQMLFKMAKDLIKNKKIHPSNKAIMSGSVAYLIGLDAFDKAGKPRRRLFR
ncbi:MAG: glycosyltransferase family 2 protein [Proteobacteria bacterium]|nr:glycosyltransferase family 2 protein [Pseudomonadota bacterium]